MGDKGRNDFLKKEYQQKQKTQFLDSLPMSVSKFKEMFDFVNNELEEEGCDDTLSMSSVYLTNNNIPETAVITWLNDNGAYCDCEVIYNIEELFEAIKP